MAAHDEEREELRPGPESAVPSVHGGLVCGSLTGGKRVDNGPVDCVENLPIRREIKVLSGV